jgi:hypothetical protein
VQDQQEQQPDRLVEVQQLGGRAVVEDRLGVPHVGLDDGGAVVVREHQLAVRHRDRIFVDVDDPAGRVLLLRDLVHVADRGDPGADVEELPHAFTDHETDRPRQERAVEPCRGANTGDSAFHLVSHCPVGGEVVASAEQVVVGPRTTCCGRVNEPWYPILVRHATPLNSDELNL